MSAFGGNADIDVSRLQFYEGAQTAYFCRID